jgi:hypothetical protein
MIANWLLTACHSRTDRFHSEEVVLSQTFWNMGLLAKL